MRECDRCLLRYHCDSQTEFICKNNNYCKFELETHTISTLHTAQHVHPDLVLVMETPDGTARCKIGEANIYIGMRDELVIDSE